MLCCSPGQRHCSVTSCDGAWSAAHRAPGPACTGRGTARTITLAAAAPAAAPAAAAAAALPQYADSCHTISSAVHQGMSMTTACARVCNPLLDGRSASEAGAVAPCKPCTDRCSLSSVTLTLVCKIAACGCVIHLWFLACHDNLLLGLCPNPLNIISGAS